MRTKAIAYLEKNHLLHIAMLELLRHESGEILAAEPGGVLLLDRSSDIYMLSAEDRALGKQLLDEIGSCSQIVVCQEDLAAYAEEKFGLHNTFVCHKVAYFREEKPELATELDIRRPDPFYVGKIKAVYHTIPEAEVDEIQRRGNLFCAFCDGQFVGFSGRHLDGSLGLLEIFEPYQGRGFGEQLERFMIRYIIEQGDIPYGEIVEGNTASENLQRKLGFEISEEIITWLL